MKNDFQPEFKLPDTYSEKALWFIFCDRKLLIPVPLICHPEKWGNQPESLVKIGTLNNTNCYAAAVDPAQAEDIEKKYAAFEAWTDLRFCFDRLETEMFQTAGRGYHLLSWYKTHKYCSQCGEECIDKEDERARICPACGNTVYPVIAPAVITAVIKDDKILLANSPRFRHDFYSVLAGFVEPGETLEECVRREIKEEVNIDVKNITYFASQPWPFPNSLMIGFTAEYAGGEIEVDGDEIHQAGWFTKDHLPKIPGKVSIARRLIDWFIENY